MSQVPAIHIEPGGARMVIASGGDLDVESGGEIVVEAGGTATVESGGTLDVQSGATLTVAAGLVAGTALAVPKVVALATQALAFGDFTDDGGTSGHIDSTGAQIPAGAIPVGFKAVVATGFTGDTTAIIKVGVAGDTDRFSSVTDQSVLASAVVGAGAATDASDGMNAAQTIRVTVTGTADWGNVSAGSMIVTVYYVATV